MNDPNMLGAQETEVQLTSNTDDEFQYLTFVVSGERLGVDVSRIMEIIEVGQMTDVPLAPDFIRGVINLRGAVLPVVDLSVRLGRGQSNITKRSCIVVVKGDGQQAIGMLVDEVSEILEVAPDMVKPPPSFGNEVRTDFIKGMGQVDDRFIVLLEISGVLSSVDLEALEHITQQSSGP
jgi:purine-binding chemotaxis protein CheW